MIHLKDINKTYQGAQPLHVLKGITLDIAEGEFVSIMGASGSGKSTLLNILGILDNYDSGEYLLGGTLIKDLSETRAAEYRNRMIGFIFQSFNLIAFKTAVENVELPLYYQGVARRTRQNIIADRSFGCKCFFQIFTGFSALFRLKQALALARDAPLGRGAVDQNDIVPDPADTRPRNDVVVLPAEQPQKPARPRDDDVDHLSRFQLHR